MAHLQWYLDPSSLIKLKKKKKKNVVKVGPPLTKLSGSAHTHIYQQLTDVVVIHSEQSGLYVNIGRLSRNIEGSSEPLRCFF